MQYTLDCKNLLCPIPVIRTQNKIKELSTGDRLDVICTDPGVVYDIPAWCRMHGHDVAAIDQADYEITISVDVK